MSPVFCYIWIIILACFPHLLDSHPLLKPPTFPYWGPFGWHSSALFCKFKYGYEPYARGCAGPVAPFTTPEPPSKSKDPKPTTTTTTEKVTTTTEEIESEPEESESEEYSSEEDDSDSSTNSSSDEDADYYICDESLDQEE